jgi:AcrR family transcriptional regulator
MPRAKQRTPELRDRLLQAAVTMLSDEGVSGLTTRRVARQAETSPPAVYELFGDKGGLVREVFFEGFRMLRRRFDELGQSADPMDDLTRVVEVFRSFVRENPVLAEVMFSQPFADFEPGRHELAAGSAVREFIVGRVRRCVGEGRLAGDPADIAHALVALAQGLASQERAGWLGSSAASMNRRWGLAVSAMLEGLRPAAPIAALRRASR